MSMAFINSMNTENGLTSQQTELLRRLLRLVAPGRYGRLYLDGSRFDRRFLQGPQGGTTVNLERLLDDVCKLDATETAQALANTPLRLEVTKEK